MTERGIIIGGEVLPGTERVMRDEGAWWSWDDPADRPDLKRRPNGDATVLAYHWTGGPFRGGRDAGAILVAAMRGRKRADGSDMSVSVHFGIGADGAIFQFVDLAIATLHIGSALNARSVSCEIMWPGTATNAAAIAKQLRSKGRVVHPAYDSKAEMRTARGAAVRCVPPTAAQLEAVVALGEMLAALPPETGVVIPRQLCTKGPPTRRRGAMEHQHASGAKLDCAGYATDALVAAGWAR
jgi:hypothetical protein